MNNMKQFTLVRENGYKIQGYKWDVENPDKTVCLIHGIGEHAGRYDRLAGFFNDNNIAVFAMDLRGHGKTDGKRGDCAPRKAVLEDVDALIDEIKKEHPDCPVVIYGHSMGGNIALDYRNRGKYNGDAAGYVISAPWVKLVRSVPKPLYVFVKAARKLAPTLTISSSVNTSVLGNPIHNKAYEKDELVHKRISLRCAVNGFDIGNALYEDTHEISGEGRKRPMLLMHGDCDKICDIAGSDRIFENQKATCEYIRWQGLYHEIHNGGPDSDGTEVIEKAASWICKLTTV